MVLIFYFLTNINLLFLASVRRGVTGRYFSLTSDSTNSRTNDTSAYKSLSFKQPDTNNYSSCTLRSLASLFNIKSKLDFAGASDVTYRPLELFSANCLATSLANTHHAKTKPSKFISTLEHSLYSTSLHTLNLSSTMSKLAISENFLKLNNSNLFLSLNIQNSIESAFNLASSNRWLLRLLPISENLTNVNNYFSSLKVLVSDPFKNSRSPISSICLSNFLNTPDYKTVPFSKPSNLNSYKLNNSLIDTFESSRNWLQKRATLTMLPSTSRTFLREGFTTAQPANQKITHSKKQPHLVLLNLISLDYCSATPFDFRSTYGRNNY
jgi:hypothetical protein